MKRKVERIINLCNVEVLYIEDSVIDFKETMTASANSVKITVVGNRMVGKSSLLETYTRNFFPSEGVSRKVYPKYAKHTTVDGQLYDMDLIDTVGGYDEYKLRPISYPHTTCFLVCYSVSRPLYYENEVAKFVSEVRHHMPHTPIILVATKVDLRDDPNQETVSEKEGKKLKRRIKADTFIECSAKNGINLNEVFEEAVRCSVKQNTSSATKICTIF